MVRNGNGTKWLWYEMTIILRNQVMISLDTSSEFPWLNKLSHI